MQVEVSQPFASECLHPVLEREAPRCLTERQRSVSRGLCNSATLVQVAKEATESQVRSWFEPFGSIEYFTLKQNTGGAGALRHMLPGAVTESVHDKLSWHEAEVFARARAVLHRMSVCAWVITLSITAVCSPDRIRDILDMGCGRGGHRSVAWHVTSRRPAQPSRGQVC